ncbi:MAG: hypothetical protein WCK98_08335 [bacterium]
MTTQWRVFEEDGKSFRNISYKEVKELVPDKTPKLGILRRAALPIVFSIFVLAVVITGIINPSSTTTKSKNSSQKSEMIIAVDSDARDIAKTASDVDFKKYADSYKTSDSYNTIMTYRQMYQTFPEIDEKYSASSQQFKTVLQTTTFSEDLYFKTAKAVLENGTSKADKQAKSANVTFDGKKVNITVKFHLSKDNKALLDDCYPTEKAIEA